ncbi:hypothetical protein D1007_59489 [Hordeum vulgare]|nr:hypothetical protein D1007_59489 [Hordeum vulgare]
MSRRPPACSSSTLKVRKDRKPRHNRRRRERRRTRTEEMVFLKKCVDYVLAKVEWYILMAEPDHIFVKPLPNLAFDNDPAAFPFFYITPSEHEKIIRKYYPEERGPITNVDPIGCWYAYAIASALRGVQHILRKDFMIQPPFDKKLGNTFIMHFTYGCDYTLKVFIRANYSYVNKKLSNKYKATIRGAN